MAEKATSNKTEKPKRKAKTKKTTTSESAKIKKLNKTIETLKSELSESNDKYLRLAAEVDNFKKRKNKESLSLIDSVQQELFVELLPIIDDFERSLNFDSSKEDFQSLKTGIELIYNKLIALMKNRGLEAIEAVDQPFDPELHEALMQVEKNEKDSNIVVEEALKGYRLKDRVIRHSKVVVNK